MITNEELREMLENALSGHFGRSVRLVGMRRRPSPYASSAPLEELHIVLAGGRVLDLIFKDLRSGVRLDAARGIRPDFVDWSRREVETYRHILPAARSLAPACLGAMWQPRRGHCGLFLEVIHGRPLWQHGDLGLWEEAARALARMQVAVGAPGRAAARRARLLRHDRTFYLAWRDRAASFLKDDKIPAAERRAWRRLTGDYDAVVQRLLALPMKFVHGECYPSNILVREGRERGRICFIDWDMAALAPAEIDLAALCAGEWNANDRARMLRAYRGSLRRMTGRAPALLELTESVALCQLHQAVQWLGWSKTWNPPRMHQQDWLNIALRLAGQLGFI